MKKTITSTGEYPMTYLVVNEVPSGYFVWNIGKIVGYEDYIPLCQLEEPSNPENFSIKVSTLKALKVGKEIAKKIMLKSMRRQLTEKELNLMINSCKGEKR